MRETHLDGLRGWAAVIVLLHHAIPRFFALEDQVYGILPVVVDGALAVYVFFVLSGYVLTVQFFRDGERRGVVDLALRRYPRLTIPILASSFVAYLLLKASMMASDSAGAMLHSEWLARLYRFQPDFLEMLRSSLWGVYLPSGRTYNEAVLWTMCLEMRGSIYLFVMMLVIGRSFITRALGLYLVLWYTMGTPFFAFFLGAWIAWASQSPLWARAVSWRMTPILSCALLIIALCVAGTRGTHRVLLPACAAVVVAAVLLGRWCWPALSSSASQFLGRISFPLYLVHGLILCSVSSQVYLALVTSRGIDGRVASVATLLIGIAASFAAATAFMPIERFAVRAGRWVSKSVMGAFTRGLLPFRKSLNTQPAPL